MEDYILCLFYVYLGAYWLALFTHLVYLIPLLFVDDVSTCKSLELIDLCFVNAHLLFIDFPKLIELIVILPLQLY